MRTTSPISHIMIDGKVILIHPNRQFLAILGILRRHIYLKQCVKNKWENAKSAFIGFVVKDNQFSQCSSWVCIKQTWQPWARHWRDANVFKLGLIKFQSVMRKGRAALWWFCGNYMQFWLTEVYLCYLIWNTDFRSNHFWSTYTWKWNTRDALASLATENFAKFFSFIVSPAF